MTEVKREREAMGSGEKNTRASHRTNANTKKKAALNLRRRSDWLKLEIIPAIERDERQRIERENNQTERYEYESI
ncbi:hypothetical protein DPX16_1717 [Anabarilius grahami]|uniref:Uncharacterized protein n=1 Tax=Anabarilius grahami TaxID=495550 RepID=A0A3N0XTL0_ANAGA|nr:hypothetical protein DPX16_1717 [Anabarilius grahami]